MIERGQGWRIRNENNYGGVQNGPLIIMSSLIDKSLYTRINCLLVNNVSDLIMGYSNDGQ